MLATINLTTVIHDLVLRWLIISWTGERTLNPSVAPKGAKHQSIIVLIYIYIYVFMYISYTD